MRRRAAFRINSRFSIAWTQQRLAVNVRPCIAARRRWRPHSYARSCARGTACGVRVDAQRTNEHFGRHRAGAGPCGDRKCRTAGVQRTVRSRRARIQHARQHDEAVDADHADRQRSAVPQHAARHRHRHRTATAQRHHATCVVRSRREGRARRDTGGSDAGTGCCSDSSISSRCRRDKARAACAARGRRPCACTRRASGGGSRSRARTGPRRPACRTSRNRSHGRTSGRTRTGRAPGHSLPSGSGREARARRQCGARVRSRRQDPGNPCQQADGANRAAQARA